MKVLFLGNSHTYYHGMPYQCREMCAALDVGIQVFMIAQPGESLVWHSRNPATQLALQYEEWDHIILQQATHPFGGDSALLAGIGALHELMPEGQSVWLYQTWCEKDMPENQTIIDRAFDKASTTFSFPVIPVADAWHEVERQDPGHELYDPDRRHAGQGGSYLAALCLARALSGRSVKGLPSVLTYRGRVLNRVSGAAAGLYQSVVDRLVCVSTPEGLGKWQPRSIC